MEKYKVRSDLYSKITRKKTNYLSYFIFFVHNYLFFLPTEKVWKVKKITIYIILAVKEVEDEEQWQLLGAIKKSPTVFP